MFKIYSTLWAIFFGSGIIYGALTDAPLLGIIVCVILTLAGIVGMYKL